MTEVKTEPTWFRKRTAVAASLLVGALMAALVLTTAAHADQPITFEEVVDQTSFAPATSAACGFPVYITQRGTAHVTLFRGADGTSVVREMDWLSGFKFVFTAPIQGTSFQFPGTRGLITYYDSGTALGSPARAVFVGLQRDNGDGPPDAGRVEFEAVVTFIGPGGIPGIDLVSILSESGRHFGIDVAQRCASLAASG